MPLGVEFVLQDMNGKIARLEDSEREFVAMFATNRKDHEFTQEMVRSVAENQKELAESVDQIRQSVGLMVTEIKDLRGAVDKIEKRDAERKEWLQNTGKSLAKKLLVGAGGVLAAGAAGAGWESGGKGLQAFFQWVAGMFS